MIILILEKKAKQNYGKIVHALVKIILKYAFNFF